MSVIRSRCIISSTKGTIVILGFLVFFFSPNVNIKLCYHNLRINILCLLLWEYVSCYPEQFLTLAFKKPKATKYYQVGSVYSKQEQQKTSNYKYLCFSDHSEEIQNLTQKVGKLESKLEEEKRQMAEDTTQKLNKVQTQVLLVRLGFFPHCI